MAKEPEDLTPEQATERDLKEIDARAAEMEGRGEPDDGGEDRGAYDGGDDPEAYLVEEERPTRRERRSSRYSELQEEAARERARSAALEVQLQALVQQQQTQPSGPSFEEFAARITTELEGLQKDEITLQTLAAGVDPSSDAFNGLLARKREIDLRRSELGYMYAQAKHAPPPQRQIAPEMAYMKSRYADVDGDPAGAALAQRYYKQQVAKGIQKPPIEVVEEAYQYARATLSGKPFSAASAGRPKPTAESRAKLTGASVSGGQGSQRQPQRVTISREDAALAHETYKYIKDPEKRLQMYYKEIVSQRPRGRE